MEHCSETSAHKIQMPGITQEKEYNLTYLQNKGCSHSFVDNGTDVNYRDRILTDSSWLTHKPSSVWLLRLNTLIYRL